MRSWRRATARGDGWRAGRRSTTTNGRSPWPVPRTDGASARLERSPASAKRVTGSASTRRQPRRSTVRWTRGDHRGAEQIWRRALEVADDEDSLARIRALNSLSINQTGGPGRSGPAAGPALQKALELTDEASALAEEIGDQFSIAMTTVQRSRILEDLGRYEESVPGFDRAIAVFEDLGARWELGDAIAERGIAKRELGRLDEAEADLRKAIRISEELGERQLASWTWRALGKVSERRGDHAEAEQRMRRSREAEAQQPR